ncbi:leucine-rich repeat neuronal protein 1-like [Saccostrea echinata]|uniref:leucine-rich repeat neuronal protein 1-like n=1 Tax=Saccostrea echinata TaxID=191078 RepID=UPI002A7F0CCD|nr:leucine-rich repeat neuronal protein 1-like [Saccostrea echinata]XP_061185347.1 leucine-rich repeat neuronal protein 1-like [Saccostrea echinata]
MVTGKLLILLTIAIFQSSSQQICPTRCDCDYKYHVTVNCSNRGLLTVPPYLPQNVSVLLLKGNSLTDLGRLPLLPSLQVLDVSDNDIMDTISGFTSLPNLLELNLHGNKLTDCPDFHNSVLTWLDISGNSIQGLDASLFHLSNLTYLNVSNNPLQNVSNQVFEYLTDLQILDLSNTSAPWNSQLSLESLSKLKKVYLERNSFKRCFDIKMSINSSQLEIIDLSENNIASLENCTFRKLPNLKELYLDGNNISDLSEKSLQSLPRLHVLSLNKNNIATIQDPVFHSLPHLHTLSLSNMPHLYYLSKRAFSGLQDLQNLELKNNPHLSYISEELFSGMKSLVSLNLSQNNISTLAEPAFPPMPNTLTVDISGNSLVCDCHIEWISKILKANDSSITFSNSNDLSCTLNGSSVSHPLILQDSLYCPETSLQHVHSRVDFPIGSSARLVCPYQGDPPPKITWITPRNVQLLFYNTHTLAKWNYPSITDVQQNGSFHENHYWHYTNEYFSELEDHPDRVVVLEDGSLYIDYVLRIDSGPYKCIVESPQNKSTSQILLRLDYQVLMEVKVFSLFVGLGCSASFFMLNLIYVFIAAAARKCISQRRREAIMQFLENFDQYKTNKLSSLRDNYYGQVARIRETYHNRMTKLRENYNTQMTRFREGASHIREGTTHRVDIIRDKYQIKQRKLREYSSQQLHQLRDTYNTQLLKVREYGSLRLSKLHKKYKLKQKHMINLLDTLNIDNCRTIIDSECVRTESMLFEPEDILCTPESRSISSGEYVTASSNNTSTHASQETLHGSDPSDEHMNTENRGFVVHDAIASDTQDGLSITMPVAEEESRESVSITMSLTNSSEGLSLIMPTVDSGQTFHHSQVTIQLGADIDIDEESQDLAQSSV